MGHICGERLNFVRQSIAQIIRRLKRYHTLQRWGWDRVFLSDMISTVMPKYTSFCVLAATPSPLQETDYILVEWYRSYELIEQISRTNVMLNDPYFACVVPVEWATALWCQISPPWTAHCPWWRAVTKISTLQGSQELGHVFAFAYNERNATHFSLMKINLRTKRLCIERNANHAMTYPVQNLYFNGRQLL